MLSAYAVATSIFGGTTPFIAILLIKTTHSTASLEILVLLCACISLFTIYKVQETSYAPKYIKKASAEDIAQIARNMLANGDSVKKVAAITNLPKEKVAKMKP